MRKLSKSMLYAVTILGMLTILTVCGGIYVSSTTNQSPQNLETNPMTLHTKAENNALQWNATWGGAGNDISRGVAVDANGFIYCTGTINWGTANWRSVLFKFAPNGTRLWNTTWGLTDSYGVAVDANGSIYCTGMASFGAGNGDLALVKFAPNGTRLWNTTWGNAYVNYGYGIAIDASGFIYTTGETKTGFSAENYTDLVLVKFAPNGTRLWNTTWGGAKEEVGYDVTVDANGSIYCTGYTTTFSDPEAGDYDLALVKFAPNGTRLWNSTFNNGWFDVGYGVAVNASGSIICCGAGDVHSMLVAFSPTGTEVPGAGGSPNYVNSVLRDVTVDASGSRYCCGSATLISGGRTDMMMYKNAPNGTLLWNLTWGGAWNDICYGVAVDANGSIYCTGENNASTTHSDMVLSKFIIPPEAPVLDPISPAIDEDGIIELNWSDVVGVEKYYLYRELSNITSVAGLTPKYVVTESNYTDTLTQDDTYYYVIVAAIGPVNSTRSNCESVTVITAPEAPILDPISLAFDEDGVIIELNWNDVERADKYYIYRELSNITSVAGLQPKYQVPQSNYTDFLPNNNNTYYYVIVAVNGVVNSTISNCKSVTAIKSLDAPVLDLISPAIDEDGIIELNWNDIERAVEYYIYRELSNITSIAGLTPKWHVPQSNYTDSLSNDDTYYYVIVAVAGSVNSTISNCESVTVSIPDISEGIPGFEFVSLLISVLALLGLAHRRRLYRPTS